MKMLKGVWKALEKESENKYRVAPLEEFRSILKKRDSILWKSFGRIAVKNPGQFSGKCMEQSFEKFRGEPLDNVPRRIP